MMNLKCLARNSLAQFRKNESYPMNIYEFVAIIFQCVDGEQMNFHFVQAKTLFLSLCLKSSRNVISADIVVGVSQRSFLLELNTIIWWS